MICRQKIAQLDGFKLSTPNLKQCYFLWKVCSIYILRVSQKHHQPLLYNPLTLFFLKKLQLHHSTIFFSKNTLDPFQRRTKTIPNLASTRLPFQNSEHYVLVFCSAIYFKKENLAVCHRSTIRSTYLSGEQSSRLDKVL